MSVANCDGLRWVEVEHWDAWTLEGPDGLVFGEVELDRDGWSWWRGGGEHDFGLESTRLEAKWFAEGGGPAVEPNDCDDMQQPDSACPSKCYHLEGVRFEGDACGNCERWAADGCGGFTPHHADLTNCDGTSATTDNDEEV